MSDRVNAMEIEDVLSSIRRLVSEDLRPAEGKVSPTPEGAPLLLTPALRVVPAQGANSTLECFLHETPGLLTWQHHAGDGQHQRDRQRAAGHLLLDVQHVQRAVELPPTGRKTADRRRSHADPAH